MWLFSLGDIHLVHATGAPSRGGAPQYPHSTPIAVEKGWTPGVAAPEMVWAGGAPFADGQKPLYATYANVEERIPITIDGADSDNAAQILHHLKLALASATYSAPIVWRMRPYAATNEAYAEVYAASVQERAGDEIGPAEGGSQIAATITLTRSPFFGANSLTTLIGAVSLTNGPGGNVVSLGTLAGDLIREGQPLNIRLDKPTTQSAEYVLLATVHSRLSATITSTKTTTSTTTGTAFTASGSLDVSALRTRAALSLRVLARLATLTAPSKAQISVTVQTAAGSTLWVSPWRTLSSDTSAQLVDLGGAGLEMLRTPLSSTLSVALLISIRSTDGTSVTATLDYVEALLCYDACLITSSGGLSTGQHYELLGAQNLSGGGYLPLIPEIALITDSSLTPVKTAIIRGQLPRAWEGASLYVAWLHSSGAHTKTDTASLTVTHAPLWRTLRGLT
jgi:hypothetical protein